MITGLGSGLYLHHHRWDTYSLYGSRRLTAPGPARRPGPGRARSRFPRYCHRRDALRFHRYSVLHSGRSSFRREAPRGTLNRRVAVDSRSTAAQRPLLYPVELRARTFVRRRACRELVGVEGFEPPTPCSQSRCATRLRHTPPDAHRWAQEPTAPAPRAGNIRSRPLIVNAAAPRMARGNHISTQPSRRPPRATWSVARLTAKLLEIRPRLPIKAGKTGLSAAFRSLRPWSARDDGSPRTGNSISDS